MRPSQRSLQAAASAAQDKTLKSKRAGAAGNRVLGANDRVNVAFIDCGVQFHGLLERGFDKRKEAKNDFEYSALCLRTVREIRIGKTQSRENILRLFTTYSRVRISIVSTMIGFDFPTRASAAGCIYVQ